METVEPTLPDTARAIRKYFAGGRAAKHNVAHQALPILAPATVVESSRFSLPEKTWDHYNVWQCPYTMKFESADVEQIIVEYEEEYHRFIRASFSDLSYQDVTGKWIKVGRSFWGHAAIFETENVGDKHVILKSKLFVEEDFSSSKESLLQQFNDPRRVIFDRLCDEIFGDG